MTGQGASLMLATPTPVLNSHNLFNTNDLDEARQAVGEVFCPHKLVPGNALSGGMVRFNHAPVRAISVNWVDYGRDVQIDPVQFEKFYLLQIVQDGSAQITSNKHQFDIRAGEACLINPQDELSMKWSQYCRKLIVRIDRTALERFAEQWFGCYLPGPLDFYNAVGWAKPQLAAARGLVDLIVQDFENGAGVLGNSEVQKYFEDSFFAALMISRRHSLSGMIDACSPAVPRAVKRAEDYVAAHAREEITIHDLAQAGEVSTRTLFESFRRFRGITPMQYVRRYRLDQVREALSRSNCSESVTQVAMRWRFEQLGRFSSLYAEVYGEKPSETLQRARQ